MKGKASMLAGAALFSCASLCATAALGNEPAEPVEAVMAVTIHNAGSEVDGMPAAYLDYFAPDTLLAQYSLGFTRDLVAAVLRQKEMHSEIFLGFEPIVNAQDSCPLKDVRYSTGAEADGRVPVTVEFSAFHCFEGEEAARRSTVVFDVVKEGEDAGSSWYVIDDIRHLEPDGTTQSLRALFGELAAE